MLSLKDEVGLPVSWGKHIIGQRLCCPSTLDDYLCKRLFHWSQGKRRVTTRFCRATTSTSLLKIGPGPPFTCQVFRPKLKRRGCFGDPITILYLTSYWSLPQTTNERISSLVCTSDFRCVMQNPPMTKKTDYCRCFYHRFLAWALWKGSDWYRYNTNSVPHPARNASNPHFVTFTGESY